MTEEVAEGEFTEVAPEQVTGEQPPTIDTNEYIFYFTRNGHKYGTKIVLPSDLLPSEQDRLSALVDSIQVLE